MGVIKELISQRLLGTRATHLRWWILDGVETQEQKENIKIFQWRVSWKETSNYAEMSKFTAHVPSSYIVGSRLNQNNKTIAETIARIPRKNAITRSRF